MIEEVDVLTYKPLILFSVGIPQTIWRHAVAPGLIAWLSGFLGFYYLKTMVVPTI